MERPSSAMPRLTVKAVRMRQSVVTSEAPGNVAGKGLDQSQVAGSILHERDQEKSGSSLK